MNENSSALTSKRESSKRLNIIAWLGYGLCLVIFLSLAFIPHNWVTKDPADSQLQSINIVNLFISRTHLILSIFSFALLLLIGVVGLTFKKFPAPGMALLLAIVGFPVCYGKFIIDNLAPWTTEAEIKGPDNQKYYFMDSSFLQGQTLAIARLKQQTWLTQSMELLGTTNGDEPRSWASVIRPAGTPDGDYGQLYLSSDNTTLVAIRTQFKCYMSYDFQTNRFRGNSDKETDDIKGISPFILMGSGTEMNPQDVKGVVDHINSHTKNDNYNGYPRLKVLEAQLDHPNTKVRLMAKELIRIIKSHEQSRIIPSR